MRNISIPMNRAEALAKHVLEEVLTGASLEYRCQQSHGEYDFDLRYPNGSLAAVEVTESTNQLQRWTSAKIRSKKDGGAVIAAKHCKKSWWVLPTNDAKTIPAIKTSIDEYLAKVEQAGFESLRCLDAWEARQYREAGLEKFFPPRVPRCVEDICYDFKIVSAAVIRAGAPPRIFIGHPVGGGTVGATVAIEAGEQEAWKDDNRRKLAAAKTNERHIVVHLEAALPCNSLLHFEPPSMLPSLPIEITHIWMIAHGEVIGNEWDEFVVWRAATSEHWSGQRVFVPRATPSL